MAEPGNAQLVEELCAEQCQRWQCGDRISAATYLELKPSLAGDPECAIELVYNEILLRESLGESPQPEEYLERFPHLNDQLRRLFAVHGALELSHLFSASEPSSSEQGQGSTLESDRKFPALPKLPGYAIVRELGRGGMGVVYEACQLNLNRTVALKMIRKDPLTEPADLTRFRAEAEAVARLHHPNIVKIYDIGEVDGRPYLSLEYVEGVSLNQHLAGTPQPAVVAAALVETLARAMHAAHENGIVHRDLKPANVLVSGGWSASALATHQRSQLIAHQIKITDFGLAKRLDEPGLTQSGAVMGTPSYMAPEQAAGKSAAIGPLTDVYALGAILYEMLTGRPPFRGTTPLETVLQVQFQEPVSPRRMLPACPRDLETICLKCLHKESYRRYGSALELAADLHSFLAGEPIRARPVGPVERGWRWCSRNKAIAGALAAVAVVALVGLTAVFAEWTRAETNFSNMLVQKQEAEKNYEAMSTQKQLADKNLKGMRVEFQRAEQNLQAARNAVREHFIDLSEIALSKEPETEKYQKRRLEQALHYFKGFVDQRPQDVEMRTEVAEANFRVAGITAKIGSSDDALAYYLQAQQLYEQLSREGHASPTVLFDLGNIYNNIGVSLMDKGQWDHAEEYFHKGLEVRHKLAQDSPPKSTMPTDPVYARHVRVQNSLGATYLNLGKLYYKTAQRAHAEKTLEEARLILQPLADAGYTESVRSLASCLNDLGVVYAETGKREAAAKAHGESLKHYLQIVADNAGNSDLRAELASTYNNSGIRLRALTQWGEARLAHQKAVQILLSLVDAYPHVTYYRNQLARVLVDLGRAQRELGQYSEACASFEKAQEHFKKSLKVDPQNADLLRSLALSYNYVGDTHSQSQQWQEASRDHEQALAIQEELVKAHPDGSDFRADLARSYSYLGELLDARGDLQAALRSQTKARDIQRELVDSRGDVIEYRFELSRTYQRIGYVHVRTGNKEALPTFELARKLQEELVKVQPDEPQFQDRLAATWCHIGELHQATGQRKAAQEAMQEAHKIRTKLREEHPDILGNNWQLAKIEHGIGVAYTKKSTWAEALPHFDVARSLYADLVKIMPENPDLRHHMVITIIAYGITLEKLGKTKEALAARMQAIEHGRVLVEKLPQVKVYRRILTDELNDAGVLQRQLGQLATAAALTLERCKLWPKDAKELHEAARELAKCLVAVQTKGQPSEEDQVLARQLGEQTVDTLRRVVELGTMPVEKLLNDPVLEPLRTREDFQKLIKARKME